MKNKVLKWDVIKAEIRQLTICYSKKKAKLDRAYENNLTNKYNKASVNFFENKSTGKLEILEEKGNRTNQ